YRRSVRATRYPNCLQDFQKANRAVDGPRRRDSSSRSAAGYRFWNAFVFRHAGAVGLVRRNRTDNGADDAAASFARDSAGLFGLLGRRGTAQLGTGLGRRPKPERLREFKDVATDGELTSSAVALIGPYEESLANSNKTTDTRTGGSKHAEDS